MEGIKKAVRRPLTYLSVGLLLCLCALGVSAISGKNTQYNRPAERAAKIAELRARLRDPQARVGDPERVADAIEKLGRERAKEAIPELIELLTFEREVNTEMGEFRIITLGARYPATSALFEIGEAALPALIGVVETHEEDSLASRNALYSISLIFRNDAAGAVNALQAAAARASSPEEARRLSKGAEGLRRALKRPAP